MVSPLQESTTNLHSCGENMIIPYCLVLTTFPAIGVKEPDLQGQSTQPAN